MPQEPNHDFVDRLATVSKNAVFIAVKGQWLAVLAKIAFRRLCVAEKTLAVHKE
jgi:hypothetical protein